MDLSISQHALTLFDRKPSMSCLGVGAPEVGGAGVGREIAFFMPERTGIPDNWAEVRHLHAFRSTCFIYSLSLTPWKEDMEQFSLGLGKSLYFLFSSLPLEQIITERGNDVSTMPRCLCQAKM